MSLLISFLYLLLHLAIILLIAYAILWVIRDWLGWGIDPMVMKFGQAVVVLLCLIAIAIWLSGVLGYSSGYRLPFPVKIILIIVTLNSSAAITAVEFDDARACEAAAVALKRLTEVRTACVPKAGK